MLYDAVITPDEMGGFVIHQGPSIVGRIFTAAWGSMMLGVGTLVLYVFLSGGGIYPERSLRMIVPWLFVGALIFGLGIVPFARGFEALFMSRSFVIRPAAGWLESRWAVVGITVWIRRYPLGALSGFGISSYRAGFPAARTRYVVTAEGLELRVPIATFTEDRKAAEDFAAAVSAAVRHPAVEGI